MNTLNAVDYSWSRPDPHQLAAAGIKLACRYLSHDSGKNVTTAEVAALHAAGIGVLANWESQPGRPLLGAPAGAQDGADAAELAEAVGFPHGSVIYPSCDTDTTAAQWPTIAAYYRAFRAALAGRYRCGVYSEADLIDYLHRQGIIDAAWQTVAWSNGRISVNADLYQYQINQTLAGGSVDFNTIIRADALGAWWPVGSPHTATPTPAPNQPTHTSSEDDEMALIVESTAGGQPHILVTNGVVIVGVSTRTENGARKIGAEVLPADPDDYAKFVAVANAQAGK